MICAGNRSVPPCFRARRTRTTHRPEAGSCCDADLVKNRFIARSRENLVFARNAVDWLAADEALIGIRTKQRSAPPLLYESAGVRDAARYLTLIGVPLLFVLFGIARLLRRRRLAGRPWVAEPADGESSA